MPPTSAAHPYPAHWEADVVLRDGGTAHIRPITPADADRLVSFYERVSDESKYYRFFAPYPRLSDRDVHRFTHHDYDDRVGLAATVRGGFLATVRYDRVGPGADVAEVAFLVEDAHQGRGLGSVLLEHITAVARERGIRRFEAEVLPANGKMIKVFTDAGYSQRRSWADGAVRLTLDLAPTAESLAVMRAREQRAEARSVQRLLAPRSVAVVGAGRHPGGAGRTVLAALGAAGFTGRLHAVNDALPPGTGRLGGVPAYRTVRDIGEAVDLAVVAVPADRVASVVTDCGEAGVQGLVVLAAGHTRQEQRALVRTAREYGMRVVGPNAFGLLNTDPAVRLNASQAPALPRAGRIGLFTQSAAIGMAVLAELERRGAGGAGQAGLSTFVSAGNRADVSGNDLLQYWDEDPATGVALMYLESVGNPRKFTRLARRTAASGTPVVVVRGGRHSGGVPPHGHDVPRGVTPEATVSDLMRQAGVIEVDTATDLVDTGLLLAQQPLPAGPRTAVIGNAEALGLVAYDACRAQGLTPLPPHALGATAGPDAYGAALAAALADPGTDAVVVTAVPAGAAAVVADGGAPGPGRLAPTLGAVLTDAAREGVAKPLLVAHLGLDDLAEDLGDHGIPAYASAERAVQALARAVRHAAWRARAADPGRVPVLDDIDEPAAARLLTTTPAAQGTPGGPVPTTALGQDEARRLLATYGIHVPPTAPAPTPDAAAEAAARLGYPVALKTTAPHLRHRADLGGNRLDIATEDELRRAHAELTGRLGDAANLRPVVQPMAPRGVDTVVRAAVDPAVGAVLSFGLAGPASELLGDVGHRLLPVTDRDAAELVRSLRAAPMLFGWRGAGPVDTAALEELLLRLGRLVDDHPAIASVALEPVVVARDGVTPLGATVRVAPPPARPDLGPRRLRAY
ncbi:bifunctional GNAT family N-acetyltransferase/acetate--CoA ligase family protein [Streptomyces avicenniae]|uniref:bifunctional acetate--CoA ligase family protein/GNAT family N-acetyltransferase n=1 Tax=Streptomyces avicenniae TaxID=500153 RepID=UPI00069BFBF6|nr:bifunctional GNAT family N-acetyltransferase/acetate--CoA ligase family protein [Streptomyces avicenniae]